MTDRAVPTDPLSLPLAFTRPGAPPPPTEPGGIDWVLVGTWAPVQPPTSSQQPPLSSVQPHQGEIMPRGQASADPLVALQRATDDGLSKSINLLRDLGVLTTVPDLGRSFMVAQGSSYNRTEAMADPSNEPRLAVARLKVAMATAYAKYKYDCSRAVWMVIRIVADEQEPYRQANSLIDYVEQPASGWQRATMDEAWRAAMEGKIAIAGRKEPNGSGHVEVFYPGDKRPAGGFGNIPRSPQLFPPIMSGSSIGYEGATGNGDRTVYDPFPTKQIPEVKFWIRQ